MSNAATSTSRPAISRRFVRETETALGELLARDLTGEAITVLMLDGEQLADRYVVVALAITATARSGRSGCGKAPRRTRAAGALRFAACQGTCTAATFIDFKE